MGLVVDIPSIERGSWVGGSMGPSLRFQPSLPPPLGAQLHIASWSQETLEFVELTGG